MSFFRVLFMALGIAFIGLCVWAATSGDFMGEFSAITAMPWGKVSLADLYLGFLVFAVIILVYEPLWIGLPVVIALFIFGNWVPAFWLAARLPKIVRKLRSTA